MKDVATASGVSLMTVSRVVNGTGTVAPEKVARVERAVRALGYQRNDLARRLRQKNGTSGIVGLVVDDLANPFFALLARAVEDAAQRRGSVVLVGSTHDDLDRERQLVTAFCARQVDGLILVPAAGSHAFLLVRITAGLAVVCADRPADGIEVDTVRIDNRDAARRGVEHLLAHGHRAVAFLGDLADIGPVQERYDGYADALTRAGIPVQERLVRRGLRVERDAAAAVVDLVDAPDPPTAIFTSNDVATIGAVHGLASRAVHHKVALVGFDDFQLAERLDPPVTVIRQEPTTIGSTAAHLLFSRLDGLAEEPRAMVLGTRLIARGSGEIPARPAGVSSTPRRGTL